MRAVFYTYLDRSNTDNDRGVYMTPAIRDLLGR